jgi:signal transduction histidine kinase
MAVRRAAHHTFGRYVAAGDVRSLSGVNLRNRLLGDTGTAINVGLGVAFAAVLAVTAYQSAAAGDDWPFDACVGTAVCAAALLRERHRASAAAIGLAIAAAAGLIAHLGHLPGQPGTAATLALLVLGGSAVRALPPRLAAGIAAAGMAVMAIGWSTATPRSAASSPAPVQFGVLGWIAALGTGLGLRYLDHRRRAAIETVRRDERLALARELHDIVAHHITGIVVQAQAARLVGHEHPDTFDGTLAGIEASGTDALAAMRRVVTLLRDADDGAATTPGPEELTELVRRFEGHGPAVHLHMPVCEASWPPEVTTTVYRVVQEALTNIARHAPHARSATISVTQNQDAVTIDVTDDAPPSPARHPHRGGYGLIGMRERVEALGGTLHAGPQPDTGWSIHATLPVPSGDHR